MTSPDGLPTKQNVRWSTTPVSLFCRSADLHDFGGMFALPEKVTENVEQIRKLGDPSDPFGSLRTSWMTEKRSSQKQHHTFANKKNIELGVGVAVVSMLLLILVLVLVSVLVVLVVVYCWCRCWRWCCSERWWWCWCFEHLEFWGAQFSSCPHRNCFIRLLNCCSATSSALTTIPYWALSPLSRKNLIS